MSWRTKGRGKDAQHFRVKPRKTLYGPARDQALASKVHAAGVEDARDSADQLMRDFENAGTSAQKVKIWRATNEEVNRLYVAAHNHNNSVEARRRLEEEYRIFSAAAYKMHHSLATMGAFGVGET